MLDQVGQARTKPGPFGASRGKLRSTGTNREWPDTMLGAKPEPDRNPTGSDRSKIGDSPEPGRSQTGAGSGQGRDKFATVPIRPQIGMAQVTRACHLHRVAKSGGSIGRLVRKA
ncbi:hypothetical protein TH8_02875 [Thalassospira profundimaris]|nr:hypothetical protein TH8_02875 [Thalassospira profundimaris]